jgi:hypothetical protein
LTNLFGELGGCIGQNLHASQDLILIPYIGEKVFLALLCVSVDELDALVDELQVVEITSHSAMASRIMLSRTRAPLERR